MTREEAQSVIMVEQKCVDRASTDRCNRDCANCDLIMDDAVINEAYNMAIKALEQPKCEDAVSRFDVLRLIDYSSHDLNDSVDNRYMQNEIKQLPSVTPKQRWISCNERLPKVREWVLCQCRAGIMDVLRLTEDGDWNKNYPHAEYMGGFVIAWMPLPDPWKGEQDE